MFARIKPCIGTENLLYYNEKKLSNGQAQCIYAGNLIKDKLSPKEKRQHFNQRLELNRRAQNTGISLILEFTPGTKLSKDRLIDIAWDFMRDIGYGEQPYLVYSHEDSACQHLHVVSTNIRTNGTRIPDHFIGKHVIKPVREAIIEKYGLATHSTDNQHRHDPRQKVQYGKTHTIQAMADTLRFVMENYHYRSLEEFNAVLRLYNLKANGGAPDSWLHRHRGLIYQITDDNGKVVNAPVKASDFHFRPTLNNLEPRFAANTLEGVNTSRARAVLNDAMRNRPTNADQFADHLRRNRLAIVPTNNNQDARHGLYFIDLASRWVLSPRDLGDAFNATAIQQTLGFDPLVRQTPEQKLQPKNQQTKGRHR